MHNQRLLMETRKAGKIRCGSIFDRSDDLTQIMAMFGLKPDASLLIEHDRSAAREILIELLYKDMAYECECMPRAMAEEFANSLLAEHASGERRFFSNGNWAKRESWNPLTESTFDSGLIITGSDHLYFCVWFQDED